MTPEEAIQRAFGAKQPKELVRCPKCDAQLEGLALIDEKGEIRCPNCGLIATYERNQFQVEQ
jgi:DNA-directed RNA polymerase subunit RPC12/RpoP